MTTEIVSMRVRQDAPVADNSGAERQAGEMALQLFGNFLRMPTPSRPAAPPQPARPIMMHYEGEVRVTATLPGGRGTVSEPAPIRLSLDSRVAPDDGIARAVQQAAEAAAQRLTQRLAQSR